MMIKVTPAMGIEVSVLPSATSKEIQVIKPSLVHFQPLALEIKSSQ